MSNNKKYQNFSDQGGLKWGEYMDPQNNCPAPDTLFYGVPYSVPNTGWQGKCNWQTQQPHIEGGGVEVAMQAQTHLLKNYADLDTGVL